MSEKVTTTWRPDTCGCELDYEWERGSNEDTRIHTPVGFKACIGHNHHTDPHQHYAQVLEENQRKNKVVNLLGETMAVKSSEFSFEFDDDRNLIVSHSQLSVTHVKEFQSKFDQEHGKGKVIIKHG